MKICDNYRGEDDWCIWFFGVELKAWLCKGLFYRVFDFCKKKKREKKEKNVND